MSWKRFFRRAAWDVERARELEAHVAMETDRNVARGMTQEEARRAAYRKLGNPSLIREDIYRMNTIGFLETIWQDLRYGVRALRLNPAFATVAILSLALGIGANTAIFHLIDAVRLRTLPVSRPQELANIKITKREHMSGNFTGPHPQATYAQWEQIRARQEGFSGVFAWGGTRFNLATGGEAQYARGLWASGETFNVIGIQPVLGRLFAAADDQKGCASPGVVISYQFWQNNFGGQPSAVGSKLTLDGHPFEVIGVTPASFYGLEVGQDFDLAVPICAEPLIKGEDSHLARRHHWWLAVMGRLKPGWTLQRATAQLNAISPAIYQETLPPSYDAERTKNYLAFRLGAFPGASGLSNLREDYEQPLWLLLAIAGLVLLIACANLANLMLARASAREREIAIRLSVGASRSRLVRQLLEESFLLAAFGALIGGALAQALSRFLVSFLSSRDAPLFVDLNADWRVLGFSAALAVLTCLLFGLVPALRATRSAPGTVMKTTGRGLTAGRERHGLRRALVVTQVALSLVLLAGALLFTRSLRNLLTLDAGFQQDGILITRVDMRTLGIPKERREAMHRDLLDRIRHIPGVESAAETSIVPATSSWWNDEVYEDGHRDKRSLSFFNRVSEDYFRTMGTPLLAGRDFNEHDDVNAPNVAIVNQLFATKILHTTNPIGKTFRISGDAQKTDENYQVVGLVRDTKYGDLRRDYEVQAYLPMHQSKEPDAGDLFMIRSNSALAALISSLKRTIGETNPAIGIEFRVFKTEVREGLLRERLMATLSGFFGFLAGLLATIGLYGVISYMVARRRNEIGIRMALGADRGRVLRMIMREAGVLLGIGLVAGSALSLASAKSVGAMLYGLKPWDPATMLMAAGALAAVALGASYLPALRAARLDPMVALRDE